MRLRRQTKNKYSYTSRHDLEVTYPTSFTKIDLITSIY
jgi:hypothetical protein